MKLSLIQPRLAFCEDADELLLLNHPLADVLALAALRSAPLVAGDDASPESVDTITVRVAA